MQRSVASPRSVPAAVHHQTPRSRRRPSPERQTSYPCHTGFCYRCCLHPASASGSSMYSRDCRGLRVVLVLSTRSGSPGKLLQLVRDASHVETQTTHQLCYLWLLLDKGHHDALPLHQCLIRIRCLQILFTDRLAIQVMNGHPEFHAASLRDRDWLIAVCNITMCCIAMSNVGMWCVRM